MCDDEAFPWTTCVDRTIFAALVFTTEQGRERETVEDGPTRRSWRAPCGQF